MASGWVQSSQSPQSLTGLVRCRRPDHLVGSLVQTGPSSSQHACLPSSQQAVASPEMTIQKMNRLMYRVQGVCMWMQYINHKLHHTYILDHTLHTYVPVVWCESYI